ncbi:MAG: tellurium resistance protein [Alphaproteobacteria bacterium HGW-Alphaproteobacteria-6]|nr:MAG: tellurium resistance protein [Alphaproteobacteria bacterium HGW-Alphaproteobacteria-6]
MGGAALEIAAVQTFFFYGTLCHGPLLRTVLGREVALRPARLPGHRVHWAAGEAFPLITADPGAEAAGMLAEGLGPEDVARLDFYEGGFGYDTSAVTVEAGAAVTARVYVAQPGRWTPGADWVLADWVARWGDTVVAAARDFMRHFGQADPGRVLARYPLMLIRGGATVRAGAMATDHWRLRRRATPGDVVEERRREVYANYFAVEEYDLRFRRFDGTMSAPVNRAVFISGDAAVVLPYDPARDRVLVIEQFRAAPHARGDRNPWQIEAIAGRVDGGETPEAAARREAREEAGLDLSALIPAAAYYPSPAAKGEYLYTYVGLADLPDDAAGLGGLASEAEDIRAHVIGFDAVLAMADSGEIDNAPLLMLVLWLERRRDALRRAAGA